MTRRDYSLVLCVAVPLALAGLVLVGHALLHANVAGVVWSVGVAVVPALMAVVAWLARCDSE